MDVIDIVVNVSVLLLVLLVVWFFFGWSIQKGGQ